MNSAALPNRLASLDDVLGALLILHVGFKKKMIKIRDIQDVVERDTWTSTGPDGVTITHEIIVGRPFQIPDDKNHDWVCPVSIQNLTPSIVPAYGVGPVDALMNAMILVKELFDKIHEEEKPTTNCTLSAGAAEV